MKLVMKRDAFFKEFKDHNVLEVDFEKKNGDIRTMICTKNFDFIPEDQRPTGDKSKASVNVNEEVMVVFDLEIEQWRSFRLDRVKSVSNNTTLTNEYVA